ncbi:MAG TPA: universal stress protein [Rhodospirillales bacterium]|nr:universal stress protein [Rhodospirillales bacterium]
MTDATEKPKSETRDDRLTFLCVVDESEELSQALRFACRRAVRTMGRVALLYACEPAEFQHWASVGDLMREERREEAEEMLHVVASVVKKHTGSIPVVFIREGDLTDELIKLIDEEKKISLLVLGAATGPDGPGPLITHIVENMSSGLRIPITIVPGSLTDEEIDALT